MTGAARVGPSRGLDESGSLQDVEHERGHRAVPHTADVILEAWAPDLAGCLEQAVAALASTYVAVDEGTALVGRAAHVAPGPPESQLVDLLDEVVFALDTADGVPVAATVDARAGGGFAVVVWLASADDVEVTGSAPKAVSLSELVVRQTPGRASCRFLVDV